MNIGITDHALERMIERGVTEGDIRSAFLGPNEALPEEGPGKRKIMATLPKGDLVVVYSQERGRKVIISAWWKNDA